MRKEIIETLYREFARYEVAHPLQACPCCVHTADHRRLRTPLRKIREEQIARYAGKALTTWGTLDDYKHFLPRILELVPTHEALGFLGLQGWLVAGKLTYGRWRTWPDNEQTAVRTYFEALFDDFLDGEYHVSENEVVDMLRRLEEDIVVWFGRWDPMRSPETAERLATAILYYEGRDHEFANWLRSPDRRAPLTEAFEAFIDLPAASVIARAIDHLTWRHA